MGEHRDKDKRTKTKFMDRLREMSIFDRRRAPRYDLRGQIVKCKCIYTRHGQSIRFTADVLEASKTGMKIMTDRNKLYPHTNMEICFELPPANRLVSVKATVLRTYRKAAQSWYYSIVKFDDEWQIGIRFFMDYILELLAQKPEYKPPSH